MADVRGRLEDCFRAVFPELDSLVETASTDSLASWDSIAMVTLIAVVEEEFLISVAPEDYSSLASFTDFLRYVERT